MCDAARRNDLNEITRLLASDQGLVNAADYDGRTPLHVAAAEGRSEVIDFLLQKGADASLKDRFGCTALHDATRNGYNKCASMLSA